MLKKIGLPLLALVSMFTVAGASQAKAAVRFGVYVGGPVYGARVPVYPYAYAPPPVYPYAYSAPYYPYVAPAPVYVYPRPYYGPRYYSPRRYYRGYWR